MKILVLAEDLRVSGTSEGIVSRSFVYNLKVALPEASISVVHFHWTREDDQLSILPIDFYETVYLNTSEYKTDNLLFKLLRKLLDFDYHDWRRKMKIAKKLKNINCKNYDLIFVRSTGLKYTLHRSLLKFPLLLQQSYLNYHDPYPISFSPSYEGAIHNKDWSNLREMASVVQQSKAVFSPSQRLGEKLSYLYGSKKRFHTIPHQFNQNAFPQKKWTYSKTSDVIGNDLVIMYHGAVQLNQNIKPLLDAFKSFQNKFLDTKKIVFELRLKGKQAEDLKTEYGHVEGIKFLPLISASESYMELKERADICIILDTCGIESEILVGKAPMLASLKKPVLVITPAKSELRRIIKNDCFLALCSCRNEITLKLSDLVNNVLNKEKIEEPFEDYFTVKNFGHKVLNLK